MRHEVTRNVGVKMRHVLTVSVGIALVAGSGGAVTAADEAPAGSFVPTGPLAEARASHSATVLPDGRVLVVGGQSDDDPALAHIWDPASSTSVQ